MLLNFWQIDKCYQISENIWAVPDCSLEDNIKPHIIIKYMSFIKVPPDWQGELSEHIQFICPFE